MNTFSELALDDRLMRAIADLGYETPTPIQSQSIPLVLAGRDLMGCAQTGTGKTASFSLPIIQQLLEADRGPGKGKRATKVLILAPTRELAQQIGDNVQDYISRTFLRHTVVYGGSPIFRQIRELQRGRELVIGTPGRVLDLLQQRELVLDELTHFVLDEADRMLDMGFINDIRKIHGYIPEHPQTLMFSATMPPAIRALASELLQDPAHVEVAPQSTAAETVEQALFHVDRKHKMPLLKHVLDEEAKGQTLIFTRTKRWADKLAEQLNDDGYYTDALHGDVRQTKRLKLLKDFKEGKLKVLVATDVAARGLDVKGVEHVINYDMPNEPENYVHRIGRTGRAGAQGVAFSFCDQTEREYLRDIERILQRAVPVRKPPEGMEAPIRDEAAPGKGKTKGAGGNNRRRGGFGSKRDSKGKGSSTRRASSFS
ncbi:MAG: DEAD/DEAH box helicase [Bacteroidetes bacterium]|nr:DEAD/DEAH box helicase [Bacteroidota bacterium]